MRRCRHERPLEGPEAAGTDGGGPGTSRAEIVRLFGVSLATIGRCVKRRREAGEVASRRSPGRPPTIGTEEQKRTLWAQLKTHPEAAVEEHCGLREHNRGARVSVATMSRAIRRLGWTYKQRRCRQPNGTSGPEALGAGGRAYSAPESSYSSMSAAPTSAWCRSGPGHRRAQGPTAR